MADEQEEKNINVPKRDYDFLIDQLQDLSKKVKKLEGGVVDLKRTEEHVVSLRLWNDKIVLGHSQSWDEFDTTRQVYYPMITLTLEGQKEPADVKLIEFYRRGSLIPTKVKAKRLVDEGVQEHGLVDIKVVDDYATRSTGVKTMAKTTTPSYVYDLILDDGRELTINADFVN